MLGSVVESVNKEVVPECVWNMQEHTGAGLKGVFVLGLDQRLKMTMIILFGVKIIHLANLFFLRIICFTVTKKRGLNGAHTMGNYICRSYQNIHSDCLVVTAEKEKLYIAVWSVF